MKKLWAILLVAAFVCGMVFVACANTRVIPDNGYRAIAYVTVPVDDNWRWIGTDNGETVISEVDTRYVTHINFAFGMIEAYQFMENQQAKPGQPLQKNGIVLPQAYIDPADNLPHYRVTLTGWIEEKSAVVDGRRYITALTALKEQKPELKVLLSVGGWDSDGFAYMAKTAEGRAEFIQSCIAIIKEYQIDGIDIDWEYPTNGGWGAIAHSPTSVQDAGRLILEARDAFDTEFGKNNKLLTIASGATQPWASGSVFAALDYVNVMTYDNDPGSGRPQASMDFCKEGMAMHLRLVGDTPENRSKLNLGLPFYNEGGPYLVPYYRGWGKAPDTSPEIVQEKMEWLKTEGFGGGFYWAYSMDVFPQDVDDPNDPTIKILQRTVYEQLNGTE